MTTDFKNGVLNYVTNNVNETTGTNIPLLNNDTTLNISITNQIRTALGSTFVYSGYLYDQETKNILIYGYTTSGGFVYLMDSGLNEIAVITEFVSGSKLFKLIDLQQDEIGYFYGLSQDDDGTKRILLLNNIFAKVQSSVYLVRLRSSYIIPNSMQFYFQINTVDWNQKVKNIVKTQDEATYFIPLTNKDTNKTSILRFTNNVGMDNEWVFTDLGINAYASDMLIEKSGDSSILYFYTANSTENTTYLYWYTIKNDSVISTKKVNTGIEPELILAKSTNEVYVAGSNSLNILCYMYIYNGSSLKRIGNFSGNDSLNMTLSNGVPCFKLLNSSGAKVGIIHNRTMYYSSQYNVPSTIVTFFVLQSYNLFVIYLATGSNSNIKTTLVTLDYNPLNYNGNSYDSYNKTVPTKARLYSNGALVFARNLYNTTLLGSTTTSTVQVPNTLLNSTTIDTEDLVGTTNSVLMTDGTTIDKNIYETLYINFINTLTVEDEDTETLYPLTATYINQNINIGTKQNCENSFVGKVKINYENSTVTQSITWSYLTDHYETSFVIDATQEVPTLDFMSNDETTVYITKDLDINTGNYYLVSQKLRIE